MVCCKDKKLCDFSECDLLALSTILTKEIINIIKDSDILCMVADFLSSLASNVALAANQRARCPQPDPVTDTNTTNQTDTQSSGTNSEQEMTTNQSAKAL